MHQTLREKLVQLVSVVVDSRDEVAGLVLIEEVERQILELREQAISQAEQYPASNAAHRLRLYVGGDERRQEGDEQKAGESQDAAEVAAPNVGIDRVRDDERSDQPCERRDDDGNARDGDALALGRHERQQADKRRNDARLLGARRRATERVRTRTGWYCVGSH